MVFAWDDRKNRTNRRKHGISFETATRIFDDPNAVSYLDRVVDDQERWHTIGWAGGIAIVLVVHTSEEQHGEEEIRIIPARKASASALFTTRISEQQRRELQRLADRPDSRIDYSDAPERSVPASDVQVGRFYRPIKQLVSLRVDADVLHWFRGRGKKYQTYMNEVLRREMQTNGRNQ